MCEVAHSWCCLLSKQDMPKSKIELNNFNAPFQIKLWLPICFFVQNPSIQALFSHSKMVMKQACCEELCRLSDKEWVAFHYATPSSLLFSLSFPFFTPTDISPPAQGVDHRHVQKELGDVIVRLHNPVVLSPTTIQVTWTVCAVSLFANRPQFWVIMYDRFKAKRYFLRL